MLDRSSSRPSSTSPLLDALEVLRERDFRGAAERATAWRAVSAAVTVFISDEREEDIRQDVLLTVAESVHRLRATTPGAAAAWLRTICRNHRAETYRRRSRTPFGHSVSMDIASIGAEPSLGVDAVPTIVDRFVARVASYLVRTESRPDLRERRLLQAIACVRRTVLEESIEELRPKIAPGAQNDLIAKWIERGRPLVIEVAEAEARDDEDAAWLYRPFAEAAARRRGDAGVPRPARRRPS